MSGRITSTDSVSVSVSLPPNSSVPVTVTVLTTGSPDCAVTTCEHVYVQVSVRSSRWSLSASPFGPVSVPASQRGSLNSTASGVSPAFVTAKRYWIVSPTWTWIGPSTKSPASPRRGFLSTSISGWITSTDSGAVSVSTPPSSSVPVTVTVLSTGSPDCAVTTCEHV